MSCVDDQGVEFSLSQQPGVVNLGLGIVIEGATNFCSHNLQNRLNQLDIPATYQFPPVGTHYWPYWEQALHDSWPVLALGMGI